MILKFKPIYKERIWGGQNLKYKLNKVDLPDGNIGESWEISAHKEGESVVSDGQYEGKSLSQIYKELGIEYFGKACETFREFPLLIKFLDASEDLSVQVHPNDEYATKYENSMGKEEIWYVLDAEPEAKIVYGISEGLSRSDLVEAINSGTVSSSLNFVYVKKGDVFFIPAGAVHAIGRGIQIAEIQQSSDITYRVYDYDREDNNGNKRELHIDKSLDVIDFEFNGNCSIETEEKVYEGYSVIKHAKCPYFSMDMIDFNTDFETEYKLCNDSFEIFMCLEGELEICAMDFGSLKNNNIVLKLRKGDTVLLTVEQNYTIRGTGKVISAFV